MNQRENPSYQSYNNGREAMDQKRYEDAITFFKQSIDIDPYFKPLELMGECYFLLGRFKEAIVPLAAAATLNDHFRARALLAKVLLIMGDKHRAKQLAAQVASVSPDNRFAKEVLDATKEIEL